MANEDLTGVQVAVREARERPFVASEPKSQCSGKLTPGEVPGGAVVADALPAKPKLPLP